MGTVCSVFVHSIETVKDTSLVFGDDSWAVIPDGYRNLLCLKGNLHCDVTSGWRIADGVINQDTQRPLQHGFIPLDQRERFCGKAG